MPLFEVEICESGFEPGGTRRFQPLELVQWSMIALKEIRLVEDIAMSTIPGSVMNTAINSIVAPSTIVPKTLEFTSKSLSPEENFSLQILWKNEFCAAFLRENFVYGFAFFFLEKGRPVVFRGIGALFNVFIRQAFDRLDFKIQFINGKEKLVKKLYVAYMHGNEPYTRRWNSGREVVLRSNMSKLADLELNYRALINTSTLLDHERTRFPILVNDCVNKEWDAALADNPVGTTAESRILSTIREGNEMYKKKKSLFDQSFGRVLQKNYSTGTIEPTFIGFHTGSLSYVAVPNGRVAWKETIDKYLETASILFGIHYKNKDESRGKNNTSVETGTEETIKNMRTRLISFLSEIITQAFHKLTGTNLILDIELMDTAQKNLDILELALKNGSITFEEYSHVIRQKLGLPTDEQSINQLSQIFPSEKDI